MDLSREDKLAAARKKLKSFQKKRLHPRETELDQDTHVQNKVDVQPSSIPERSISPSLALESNKNGSLSPEILENQSSVVDSHTKWKDSSDRSPLENKPSKSENSVPNQAIRTNPQLIQDPQVVIQNLLQDRKDLSETIERLADALQALASEKAELQHEVNRLTADLNTQFEIQEKQTNLEGEKLQDLQLKLSDAHSLILRLEEMNADLERGQLESRSRVEMAEMKISDMDEKLKDAQKEIDRLSSNRDTASSPSEQSILTQHVTQLELQLTEKEHRVLEITQTNQDLQDNVTRLENVIQSHKVELNEWKIKAEQGYEDLQQLNQTLQSVNADLDRKTQELDTVKSDAQTAMNTIEQELIKAKETISALQKEVTAATIERGKYQDVERQLREANDRVTNLLNDNSDLVEQLDELRNRCIQLSNERAELMQRLDTVSRSPDSRNLSTTGIIDKNITTGSPSSKETQTAWSSKLLQQGSQTEIQMVSIEAQTGSPVSSKENATETKSAPTPTATLQQERITSLEDKIRRLESEKAVIKRDLEQEQKLTTLLTAEVETLPDYIQIYHRERKALVSQMQAVLERLKQEGIEFHPATTTEIIPQNSGKHTSNYDESFPRSTSPVRRKSETSPIDLVTAYNGAKKGAVQGLLLQEQLTSVIQGCRLCHGSPIITL